LVIELLPRDAQQGREAGGRLQKKKAGLEATRLAHAAPLKGVPYGCCAAVVDVVLSDAISLAITSFRFLSLRIQRTTATMSFSQSM
jgi:hypothetical protein